ncbi:hypothetical protein [Cellulomonas flavigena]|uniref:hypothetical protein n=1 Tax=Cellulomonas flavigena TaxID=1711 RepID=UPI00019E47F9|nr:hypothetical protein [Cellulomonas flavigena]
MAETRKVLDAYDAFWRRIRRLIAVGLLSATLTVVLVEALVALSSRAVPRGESVTVLLPAPSSDTAIAVLSFLVVLSIALQVAVSTDRVTRPSSGLPVASDVELAGRTLLLENVARLLVFLSWLTAIAAVRPHLADAPRVLDVAGVGGPLVGALLVSFFAADAAELASDPDEVTLRIRARRQVRLERLEDAQSALAARRSSSTAEHVQDLLVLGAPVGLAWAASAAGWTAPSAAGSVTVVLAAGVGVFTMAAYMAATRDSLVVAAFALAWVLLGFVLWAWAWFSAWAALGALDRRVAGVLAAVAASAVVLGTTACLTLSVVSRGPDGRRPLLRGAALAVVRLDLRSVRSDVDSGTRDPGNPVVHAGALAAWPWGRLTGDLHPDHAVRGRTGLGPEPVSRGRRLWSWTVPFILLVALPAVVYLIGP